MFKPHIDKERFFEEFVLAVFKVAIGYVLGRILQGLLDRL